MDAAHINPDRHLNSNRLGDAHPDADADCSTDADCSANADCDAVAEPDPWRFGRFCSVLFGHADSVTNPDGGFNCGANTVSSRGVA